MNKLTAQRDIDKIGKMLLNVLEDGRSKIEADQSFSITEDFIEKISNIDGKIIINNFQNQSISVDSRKQLVKAVKLIDNLKQNPALSLPKPATDEDDAELENRNLYLMIFEEIQRLGSFQNLKNEIIKKAVETFDGNRKKAMKLLGISYGTISNTLKNR